MVIWFGLLRLAFANLNVHRLRSALTVLSMVFGTGAVIATLSSQAGAAKYVRDELEKMGTNVIKIRSRDQNARFKLSDKILIRKYSDLFSSISIVEIYHPEARYGSKADAVTLVGSEPPYFSANNVLLSKGRIFDNEDALYKNRVAVIGAQIRKNFFGNENPLGKTIQLFVKDAVLTFQVVGVLKEKGGPNVATIDSGVFIPNTVFEKIVPDEGKTTSLTATLTDTTRTKDAKTQIKALLKNRFPDGLKIEDASEAIERTKNIWAKQNLVGICLSLISLLTGGVGIMNIMLLSVTQRRKEIGLRKAVGATDLHILAQFLIEAIIVCFSGGVLGIIVGTLFGQKVAELMGQGRALISLGVVVMALLFALFTGFIFGLLPALRAARLDPYEALRG